MSHTSGPWVLRKRIANQTTTHYYLFHVGNPDTRETVCECVNEFNARLIAAAPELLEALIAAKRMIKGRRVDSIAMKFIEDAIAKAEGRQ
jgi:hypothetical protein